MGGQLEDGRRTQAGNGGIGEGGQGEWTTQHGVNGMSCPPLSLGAVAASYQNFSSADLLLSRAALDRDAVSRRDRTLIPALLRDPSTVVLAVDGNKVPVREEAGQLVLDLRSPRPGVDAADGVVRVYLGRDGERRYLAELHPAGDAPYGTARGLRSIGAALSARDTGLAATAIALANWHTTHLHCPRCGAPTTPVEAGWVRRCGSDGTEHYPRTDPAVIMSVIDDDDRILLARGAQFPTAVSMSVLAGFVEPGESLEAAVAREVAEEVGITVDEVTYLGNQPWPFPASLMLGFTARAHDTALRVDGDEIKHASWFTRTELLDALTAQTIGLPSRLSIARVLIEHWYGERLPDGAGFGR